MIAERRSRFFLKRCGAPSTCEGVVDIFRLTKPKNIIGRNTSQADFYLNSSINKCLISRQHAIISLTNGESGSVDLSIKDQSLNGTFVNDVKIQGVVPLKVGDTITFGHTNGASLKGGMHSPQTNSEFRFVVQMISDSPSKPSTFSDGVKTFKEPMSPALNSTASYPIDVSPVPTQPSKTRSTPESSPVLTETRQSQSTPLSGRSKVINESGVRVEPQFDKVTSQGRAGMIVATPGFAKLANSPPAANAATTVCNQPTSSSMGARGQRLSTPAAVAQPPVSQNNNCSTPHRKLQGKSLSVNPGKSLVYVLPKTHPVQSTSARLPTPPGPRPSPTSRGHQAPACIIYSPAPLAGLGNLQNPKPKENNNTKNVSKDSGIYDDFRELDEEEPEDMAIDSDGSDEDIFALASVIQSKVTNFTDDDDNFSPIIPDSQTNTNQDPNADASAGALIPGLVNHRGGSGLDEERYSAGEPTSPVVARCASPVFEVITPVGTQGSQQKLATRNGGKRKIEKAAVYSKKLKTGTKTNKVKGHENPGVDIEICSSIDCCRPLQRKKTAAWVQCDDCDSWYHVDCVGCSYNKVKQSTASFHCGCI